MAKKEKEDNELEEICLPAILNDEAVELSVSDIVNFAKFDSIPKDIDSTQSRHIPLKIAKGKKHSTYLISHIALKKHIFDKENIPKDVDRVRTEVLNTLRELKSTWVRMGTLMIQVNTYKLYRAWKYETFKEYYEQELKLKKSAVYEIMQSTKLLMDYEPDTYKALLESDTAIEKLPSYYSIYLLAKDQSHLEKKGVFQEVFKRVVDGELSTRELQAELKKVLRKGKRKLSTQTIVSRYNALYKEMKRTDIPEDIIEEVSAVLKKLKKIK